MNIVIVISILMIWNNEMVTSAIAFRGYSLKSSHLPIVPGASKFESRLILFFCNFE